MKKPIPFGKYYLLDRISVGGMAEVFRAKAFGVEGFERLVAVKRILPAVAEDTDFITMFIDEAKIAVQLNHANIAQIFDLGKVGEAYFIALEYVHGKDLRTIFDVARQRSERLPMGMACYVMMKVLEGLDYAHNKRDVHGGDLSLVHRDVSPQNVLISFDGDVKLIDFGIAKAAGKSGQTQTGILKGKFGYLSPEQIEGEAVDRRSDVFGAGVVLYELLALERLFLGSSDYSTVERVRRVELPSPAFLSVKVPLELEQIVLKALSRNLQGRFQTAMELHDALQSFMYSSGESFGRRDLSTWMRKQFPEEVTGAHAAWNEPPLDTSTTELMHFDETEMAAYPEFAEAKAMINETRDAPGEPGRPKGKSPVVGKPSVAVAAEASSGLLARSVPPPPPSRVDGRGSIPPGKQVATGVARSLPPLPPRWSVTSAAPMSAIETPVVAAVMPKQALPTGPGRSHPASPARASAPPGPRSEAASFSDDAETRDNRAPTQPRPEPSGNPALDMDWDDDELSTQIYDRPEDQFPGADGHASLDGLRETPAHAYRQASVATYVPPSPGGGAWVPSVHISPRAYTNSEPAPASPRSMVGIRPAPSGPPTITLPATVQPSRTLWYAGMAISAMLVACFGLYMAYKAEKPGVVQLTTHPADATALFDGKTIGSSSPFVVTSVAPGEKHLLEVRKEGYQAWSQEVQVQSGQTLQFPVTLQPGAEDDEAQAPSEATAGSTSDAATPTGGFSLESTPPGAQVFLDEQELGGTTPLRVANLLPRTYEVLLKLPGFRAYKTQIEVRPGVDLGLPRITLVPERLQVQVVSEPSGASAVAVRGEERRPLGRTPASAALDNGDTPWTIEVSRDHFEPFRQELVAEGTQEIHVSASLKRINTPRPQPTVRSGRAPRQPHQEPAVETEVGTGTLRINSRPWSQVYIDGKLVGNTPQMNVSLPAGQHRISLHSPEFNLRKNLTVTIRAGEIETQIISLQ